MYTEKPYPGRFEGNSSQLVAEVVSNVVDNGFALSELGNVESFGYWAFVKGKRYGFILSQDNNGFVTVSHGALAQAQAQWEKVEQEYKEFCEGVEED